MSPASVFAKNNTALITGGASGVGLAVATLCRKHGMKLAIVDNNADYLAKAKESLGDKGSDDVETYQVDVSQIDQWKSLKEKVQQKFKTVDFLMLNAGIGLKGGWEDADYFKKVSGALENSFRTEKALTGVCMSDHGRQPLRRDQRPQHLRAGHTRPGQVETVGHRHHGLQAGHHEPTWQRRIQRFEISCQDSRGASEL